jgi:hypothetical protein
MQRGQLIGKLRERFGSRLGTYKGSSNIDTNGDEVEVFFDPDENLFKVEGTIVELGSGQHVSYSFENLEDAMDAIDRLIAIEGPMPSVPEADLVIASPAIERLEAFAEMAPVAPAASTEPLVVG